MRVIMMFVSALLAGSSLAAAAATPAGPPVPPAPVAPPSLLIEAPVIDAALKSLVDSHQILGVSALVYQANQEVYFGAFGMADRENNVPMARDTVALIYSMTKPVTGVALMKLYERGKFKLDDPLEMYAP